MSDCMDSLCGLGGIKCPSCSKDDRIAELQAQLADGYVCDVCAGDPTSVENCACNGTGQMHETVVTLRKTIFELEAQLAEAEQDYKFMTDIRDHWLERAEKAEAQLATKVDTIGILQERARKLESTNTELLRMQTIFLETIDKAEAQLAEANEIIVCLETDMPLKVCFLVLHVRLLTQRASINKLQAQLDEQKNKYTDQMQYGAEQWLRAETAEAQLARVHKAKAKIDERISGKTVGEIKKAGDWPLCEASTWLYQALEDKT